MPRGPRDDAPGAAHHVMVRGIERRSIFADDRDRAEFVRRLIRLLPELGFRCFAWVLMPNHVHLVVRSGAARVWLLMARLATGYAGYFNRRHDRVGHLFQNRFRSRHVTDDSDLIGLVLYVCRNPLEARIVASPLDLESHPWCGLGALVGRRPPYAFEAVQETLELFDAEPERARCHVRRWLGTPSQGDAQSSPVPTTAAAASTRGPARSVSTAGLDDLLGEVSTAFGVTVDELRSRRRGKKLAAARSMLAMRASAERGVTGAEVARVLGTTRAAVSLMLERERALRGANNLTT
jgi:REP element-mobilizing transposase RayT